MKSPKLKVENMDNRGGDEVSYGFIYFNDGTRIVYADRTVHDGTGGWDPITREHRELAQKHLDAYHEARKNVTS